MAKDKEDDVLFCGFSLSNFISSFTGIIRNNSHNSSFDIIEHDQQEQQQSNEVTAATAANEQEEEEEESPSLHLVPLNPESYLSHYEKNVLKDKIVPNILLELQSSSSSSPSPSCSFEDLKTQQTQQEGARNEALKHQKRSKYFLSLCSCDINTKSSLSIIEAIEEFILPKGFSYALLKASTRIFCSDEKIVPSNDYDDKNEACFAYLKDMMSSLSDGNVDMMSLLMCFTSHWLSLKRRMNYECSDTSSVDDGYDDKNTILKLLFVTSVILERKTTKAQQELNSDFSNDMLQSSLKLLDEETTDDSDNHNPKIIKANTQILIDLCYRLAIATYFLSKRERKTKLQDKEDTILYTEKNFIRLIQQEVSFPFIGSVESISRNFFYSHSSNNKNIETDEITFSTFVKCHKEKYPLFSYPFASFFEYLICIYPPSATTTTTTIFFPQLNSPPHTHKNPSLSRMQATDTSDDNKEDVKYLKELFSPEYFGLSCTSKNFHGKWHQLYNSDNDGLSFNRILNSLLGYHGPTIMILQNPNGDVFGAYTTIPWKENQVEVCSQVELSGEEEGNESSSCGDGDESSSKQNNTQCFLFSIKPNYQIMTPLPRKKSIIRGRRNTRPQYHRFNYCQTNLKKSTNNNQKKGIGFGGTAKQPRLFLNANDLEQCYFSHQDSTFEQQIIIPSSYKEFDLSVIDIYGVGSTSMQQNALDGQKLHRDVVNASLQKARRVDKRAFLNDFRSGLIESKAFAHQDQVDKGRT